MRKMAWTLGAALFIAGLVFEGIGMGFYILGWMPFERLAGSMFPTTLMVMGVGSMVLSFSWPKGD